MSSILKVDQIQLSNGNTPTAGDLGLNTTGSVLQTVTHENPNIGTRLTISSSTPVEMSSAYRISITPNAVGNKILVWYQYHLQNNNNVYGGIWPAVTTNGGTNWYNAVAQHDSSSGTAKGTAPASGQFAEGHRNASTGGILWNVFSQQAIWDVTTTDTHIFSLWIAMGSGNYAVGDNGPNVTAIAQEIAG